MPGGVIRAEHERVWHFATVLEGVDSTHSYNAIWELRFTPANIQRGYYVVEQIGRDASGIVPYLRKRKTGLHRGALRSRTKPSSR